MEKYRNSSASLNQNRFLNTGPLYTMCGSNNSQQPQQQHQQLQHGPQLLMNTASVGTSTRFQFVPARHSSTNSFSGGPFLNFDMGTIAPIYNSVKTFFSNLLKPKVVAESVGATTSYDATTEKRKCSSAPNIYMGIMSDSKCASADFDKTCFVDLTDYKMLAKLSSSTKSFSDFNLPISSAVSKSNCTPLIHESKNTKQVDLSSSLEEEAQAHHTTKESIAVEGKASVPAANSPPPSPVPVPLLQAKKKTNCRTMPNVPTRPRRQCSDGKRPSKEKSRKAARSGKNKKEKGRHELALKIHEDIETETEAMSADEWDEPLVIITAAAAKIASIEPPEKVVCFSKDDFPAMSDCNPPNATTLYTTSKQTWELPRLSHCYSALNGRKQRQISECDSEDSFIVFDNDDSNKFTPSSVESNQSICERIRSSLAVGRQRQISESSDDDFICFELEHSDSDDDDDVDCYGEVTSDSDCESEVDVKASGTNPPDSGFEDKKVNHFVFVNIFLCAIPITSDVFSFRILVAMQQLTSDVYVIQLISYWVNFSNHSFSIDDTG